MTITRLSHVVRVALFAGVVLLTVAGCMEQTATKAPDTLEPTMDASLVLSTPAPATGTTVDVFAQIGPAAALIGSFTARIRYDTTYLRYQTEIPIADQALRATNATSGLVRFAGAASAGVTSGRLAGYRFLVLRPNAVRTLQLVVDEIHTVARADAASMLRSAPNRVELAP